MWHILLLIVVFGFECLGVWSFQRDGSLLMLKWIPCDPRHEVLFCLASACISHCVHVSFLFFAKHNDKQERLEEKTIALEDTQERLHAEQRSYDRKLTSINAEYERNLNGLINHTGMSHLLQAAIDRTGAPASGGGEDSGGGGQFSAAGGAVEISSAGGGVGVDTTQDAMAKVLHERWLSEREKAKTLEARLSEAEARMEDMDEVRRRLRMLPRNGSLFPENASVPLKHSRNMFVG